MTRPGIHLPAINRTVTIAAYVAAIRKAKANPDARFQHGLTCWWSCTGADIVAQFRHDALAEAAEAEQTDS